ncbi:hypothetical protein E6C60_3414 [Paenibacillus algicola]|uniref:Uncharacterized protein n=1 Tax=Paenibacillus algicola TaxID=2565926 RepID=A0A4P8XPD9_9BACL|nr:hypothetical protein E6C60_3414 [Paenibacillus algicola]
MSQRRRMRSLNGGRGGWSVFRNRLRRSKFVDSNPEVDMWF